MRRDLGRLADTTYDLLVVGAGIYGACIARDAALRGLRVAWSNGVTSAMPRPTIPSS